MDLQTGIAHTLRNIRHEKNLTMRQVCAKSYMSIGHLSDVERGKKMASYELLEQLTKGLGVSTVELLEEITEYLKIVNGDK